MSVSREALASMTNAEIVAAHKAGEIELGKPAAAKPSGGADLGARGGQSLSMHEHIRKQTPEGRAMIRRAIETGSTHTLIADVNDSRQRSER